MRQSFANRLAAGGFWAISVASLSCEIAARMREHGVQVPVGNGSDAEVFTICGLGAFEHIVNAYLPEGARLHVEVRPIGDGPKFYDRHHRRITLQQWTVLQEDLNYKRVALWENDSGDRHVSTVWTGIDPSQGHAQIFETIVVGASQDREHDILHTVRCITEEEALQVHHALVAACQRGEL